MNLNETILLASASPRRKEICEKMGLSIEVMPAKTELPWQDTLSAEEAVLNIAKAKAKEIFQQNPSRVVIGSDTVVLLDDCVMGKPKDETDAAAMLRHLSGKTHRVLTAVYVCTPEKQDGFVSENFVTFANLSEQDIAEYIQTGEPMDKAGAYGIQGYGCRYIRHLDGDFFAVMGLPAEKLWSFLKSF